jgi:hypothetical protein
MSCQKVPEQFLRRCSQHQILPSGRYFTPSPKNRGILSLLFCRASSEFSSEKNMTREKSTAKPYNRGSMPISFPAISFAFRDHFLISIFLGLFLLL